MTSTNSSAGGVAGSLPETAKEKERGVSPAPPKEVGGRDGPEPTRYGDWEKNGRCIDF